VCLDIYIERNTNKKRMVNKMDMWDKAIELYIAMQKAYGELPEGVYESAKTQSAEAEYYALLSESGLMDSQIVDECWGMEF
jgi:hypothetical protein